EGTQGAVNEAGGEDGFFAGASAPFDETAGDFSHRGFTLFVIARQRKEINAFARNLGHRGRCQQQRVAHLQPAATASLLGDATRFQAQGSAANRSFNCVYQNRSPKSKRRSDIQAFGRSRTTFLNTRRPEYPNA